jgi:hypothetical protein
MVLGGVLGYDTGDCYGITEGEPYMSGRYPEIVYTEEGRRAGKQIEDVNLAMDAKVAWRNALSRGNGQTTGSPRHQNASVPTRAEV